MLTNRQNRALSFFLARAMFLGVGVSNIFALAGKDAWISGLIGIIIGLGLIWCFQKFRQDIKGSLISYLAAPKLLNYLIKTLFFLLYLAILAIGFLAFTNLVSSYYLNYTPALMIGIPLVLLIIYLLSKGLKCLGRVGEILFPLCLCITIIKILLLTETANLNFFLPIYTNPLGNILLAALTFAVLSTSPFLLLITEKMTLKQSITNYLIGAVISLFVIVNITSVFGDALVRMFSYPEYAILRKIEFFKFFENVENIIAFIWLADLFIILSLTSIRLKELLPRPKYIAPLILIGIMLIINLYVVNNFDVTMYIYRHFIYFFFGFIFLIIILLFIKKITLKK